MAVVKAMNAEMEQYEKRQDTSEAKMATMAEEIACLRAILEEG